MRSKLADRSTRRDRFHQKAKAQGFLARAVYKLEEIDDKFEIFEPGQRVLDLGCAPGSWLQYARGKVGPSGQLVGLDRGFRGDVAGARIVIGDVMTIDLPAHSLNGSAARPSGAGAISIADLKGDLSGFDVVLSDMAPDTSGIRSLDQARSETLFERALEIATEVLAPGGNFVGKLFMGADFKALVDAVRKRFAVAKTMKPVSSRQISIEQYVIGKGRK